jgi:hypothetical protein
MRFRLTALQGNPRYYEQYQDGYTQDLTAKFLSMALPCRI